MLTLSKVEDNLFQLQVSCVIHVVTASGEAAVNVNVNQVYG